MKKEIKKIIVNEGMPGDFRAFVIGTDEWGNVWHIRGYGKTRKDAEKVGIERFNGKTEDFYAYGYMI